MFDSSQNWQLFGYDVRKLGDQFRFAWRDLLWSYDSPVRKRLDEPVALQEESGSVRYQSGRPTVGSAEGECLAVALPEELVLIKELRFPTAVESEIEGALSHEVHASSPFSGADTAHGWTVIERDEEQLTVALAITSRSAAMTHLATHYDKHAPDAQEVWAIEDEKVIVLRGFGEGVRDRLYRKRLLRVGGMILGCGLLVILMAATSTAITKAKLGKLQENAEETQKQAAMALRMRNQVATTNEISASVTQLADAYPSPHLELARLTTLLPDDAYLERFTAGGRELDIRGRAADASGVMNKLVQQPVYAEVEAVTPIRKVPGSDMEQFHLRISLAPVALGVAP